MSQPLRRGGLVLVLVIGLAAVSIAPAKPDSTRKPAGEQVLASAAQAEENEVVLPSRVASAIERTQNAVDRAEEGPAATKRLLAHIAQEEDAVPLPDSVATPIRKARRALRAAVTQVEARRYVRARQSLKALRVNVREAHRAGMAQIGLPPSDPEEDTPPGPVSVLAVLSLEHRVNVRLVPVFDGLRRDRVVTSLRYTLWLVHDRRNEMLDTVIGLDPEGDGADYADGMADTLPAYTAEVRLVTTALQQYRLTSNARLGLNRALDRIQATQAKVNKAFGGGE